MIVGYCDASIDLPIVSVGYVLYRSGKGDQDFLTAGTRLLNADQHDREIEWSIQRAEYYAAIIATRAALDYGSETFLLHMDCDDVVTDIRKDTWRNEAYFEHSFRSFIHRFDNWHITLVNRDNNEQAHEQARVGLKVGRDLHQGTV